MDEKPIRQYPIPSVRAIIENENREVLILKRAARGNFGSVWCLPSGKIDFGCSAVETVRREVKEETGLNCTEIKFLFSSMDCLLKNIAHIIRRSILSAKLKDTSS